MRLAQWFTSILLLLCRMDAAAPASRPLAKPVISLPFQLDAGRILVEATFRTPDGGVRKALAWFNMGMKAPILRKALYEELGVGADAPLRLAIGDRVLEAPAREIGSDGETRPFIAFPQYFGPYKVEAMLPASFFSPIASRSITKIASSSWSPPTPRRRQASPCRLI